MKAISIYAPKDRLWWDTFFKRIEDLSADIRSNIIDELYSAKMKNRTTLEDVIEEVCLRTDSEDDSTMYLSCSDHWERQEEGSHTLIISNLYLW